MSAKVQIGTVFLCKHLCQLHLCYKTSLLFNCRNRNIRFSCNTFPKKRFFFHHVAIHRKRLSGVQNFFTRPHKHFFKQCEDLTRISSDRTRCLWSSLHERHFSPLTALDIRKNYVKIYNSRMAIKKQLSEHCLVFFS